MTINIDPIGLKKDRAGSSSCCCKCFTSLINIFKKNICDKRSLDSGPNYLDLLPYEIVIEISKYLPVKSLVNFGTTSRRYYQIVSSSSSIWSHLFLRDFPDKVSVLKAETRSAYEIYKSEALIRKTRSRVVDDNYKSKSYHKTDNQPRTVAIVAAPFFAGVVVYRKI